MSLVTFISIVMFFFFFLFLVSISVKFHYVYIISFIKTVFKEQFRLRITCPRQPINVKTCYEIAKITMLFSNKRDFFWVFWRNSFLKFVRIQLLVSKSQCVKKCNILKNSLWFYLINIKYWNFIKTVTCYSKGISLSVFRILKANRP